ncbi:MAG: arsenosugar biosynthesis radical SAM protein ArsS [Deltaproteobacteria bacterium]|nr:arsenosugar biosynthesis radical SAM protein ArsS [Deltaproteobacteria bacterium]
MQPFAQTLRSHGLNLVRDETSTLQINLGRLCNQACRHCHLEAGPGRKELMGVDTVGQVADYAQRGGFNTVDITGGAPELNPYLPLLVDMVRPYVRKIILRINLTAIGNKEYRWLVPFLAERGVCLVASLPSLDPLQTDAQRGQGVFQDSLAALRFLNEWGYGLDGKGKELDLVSNPVGAAMPPDQAQSENRFREELLSKWNISFNNLYIFANVPLGRFKAWLMDSDNLKSYQGQLATGFNPGAVRGLMCRSMICVSWEGILYDCDFNLAARLPYTGRRVNVSQMAGPPPAGAPIEVGDHCYACTASSGFT